MDRTHAYEPNFELRCHYCGARVSDGEWELGLRNPAAARVASLADFAITCRACNLVKGSMSESEFRRHLARKRTRAIQHQA